VTELQNLVAGELSLPVDPRVNAIAAAIAAEHGHASRAVLFYGSCLREQRLDGLMLDFYLIVSDYRAAYRSRWLALANRLVPPNVFYFKHDGLAAKYAVLSETDFQRECSASARTASVFARFAQPSRIVWTSDDNARDRAIATVSHAAPTVLELTRPTLTDADAGDPSAIWKQAFRLTFGTELRAERSSRPHAIVAADTDRYRRFADAAGFAGAAHYTDRQRRVSERAWRQFQRRGKRASVLRLAKAAFTFTGGADYIAWKINRHADAEIALKPWQRRHPLLAGISLLPRLLKSGAVR
jgi:hypothetical protein